MSRVVKHGSALAAVWIASMLVSNPALACPDPSLGAQVVSLRTADLRQPRMFGITAGGVVNIAGCPMGVGSGYFDARPNLTLEFLDTARGAALDLRIEGTCDTVLLVNDPLGRWSLNDDADGTLDPHLTLEGLTPGQYDLWLGTYGPTPCSATLAVSVQGAMTLPAAPQPSWPAPMPGEPRTQYFAEAWFNGEPVDGCLNYGRNCGQPAADNFCQAMGFERAIEQAFGFNPVSRTLVLGDNRICTIPNGCGHLVAVTCIADGAAAPQPPAANGGAQQGQYGFFAEAWYNGERVDGCLNFGRNCGQDAADRFCQVMGYIYAVDGAYSTVVADRSLVLGDNRICERRNGCGQLVNVTCVPSPEALWDSTPAQPPAAGGAPVK